MQDLYKCSDYKAFLAFQIELHSAEPGYKGRLADAAGFNRSFLSHVLKSHVHLSPDHAAKLTLFWALDTKAQEFFITLVLRDRAGSDELRTYLDSKLNVLRAQTDELADALPATEQLRADQEMLYYSSWHLSAIHVLAGIPGYETTVSIAKRLELPVELTLKSIEIFVQMGLVRKSGDQWQSTERQIHAKKNSIYNWLHQKSWREQAMSDLIKPAQLSFHYSGIHSMSQRDFRRLRKELIALLERFHAQVILSPEETITCLNLDFFEVREGH